RGVILRRCVGIEGHRALALGAFDQSGGAVGPLIADDLSDALRPGRASRRKQQNKGGEEHAMPGHVLHPMLAQCIWAPPSTTRVWPVMKSLSLEAKNTAAPVRSSGFCMRLSARSPLAAERFFISASSGFSCESVLPGAMQFTQILYSPSSLA